MQHPTLTLPSLHTSRTTITYPNIARRSHSLPDFMGEDPPPTPTFECIPTTRASSGIPSIRGDCDDTPWWQNPVTGPSFTISDRSPASISSPTSSQTSTLAATSVTTLVTPTSLSTLTRSATTTTSSNYSPTNVPPTSPSRPGNSRSIIVAAVSGFFGLIALIIIGILWYWRRRRQRMTCWSGLCRRRRRNVREGLLGSDTEMSDRLQSNASTTSLTSLLGSKYCNRGQGQGQDAGGTGSQVTGSDSNITMEILHDGDEDDFCGSRRCRMEYDRLNGRNQRCCERSREGHGATHRHPPQRCHHHQTSKPQLPPSSFKQTRCPNARQSFDLKPWHLGCALGVNAPLVVVHDPDGQRVDTVDRHGNGPSYAMRQVNQTLSPKPAEAERSRWSLLQRFPSPPPKAKKNQAGDRKNPTSAAEGSRCRLKAAQSIRRICLAAYHSPYAVHPSDTQGHGLLQDDVLAPLSSYHFQQQQHRQPPPPLSLLPLQHKQQQQQQQPLQQLQQQQQQQNQQRSRQKAHHYEHNTYIGHGKSPVKSIQDHKRPIQNRQWHRHNVVNDINSSSNGISTKTSGSGSSSSMSSNRMNENEGTNLPIIVIVTDELKYPAKVESPTLPSALQLGSNVE
ncbi:hypothetical protein B0O80DRAFT_533116 [Mortierella sp. GBAus27b]|nr:hypothetical protein B0O80DRAFT_533116 [Mortierella sp. GBAus27b]